MLFWKIAGVGESAPQTPATMTGALQSDTLIEYRGFSTNSPLEVADYTGQGTTATATSTSVQPAGGVERLVVCTGVVTSAARNYSAETIDDEAVGVTERSDQYDRDQPREALQRWSGPLPPGGPTAGPRARRPSSCR